MPEPLGLRFTFEETSERELAERVAADVVANLTSLTGGTLPIVWFS